MADSARHRHCGMNGVALGLIGVTGGTVGILGEDAGVLDGVFDGGRRHCRRQKQQGNDQLGNDQLGNEPCAGRELHS